MDGRMTTIHNEKDPLQRVVHHPLDPLSEEEIIQTTRILNTSGRITLRMRIMAYSLPALLQRPARYNGRQFEELSS